MVFLEAQFQGLPVIAYDSLGVPLVVKHGETGLLASENDMEAMRHNLRKLLAAKSMRTSMGEAGRKKVEQSHSLSAAATRLKTVFSELL